MNAFGTSQGGRREDVRFLTGQGRYMEDVMPAGALHAVVVRSSHAHAAIRTLDVAEAEAMPGVRLVVTADRLLAAGVKLGIDATVQVNSDGSKGAAPFRPCLAQDRVRFVGEPIAVVVAETLAQARDAAEAVEVDYDTLPVKIDLDAGGPVIHPEAPGNVAFDWSLGDAAAVEAAFAKAAHRIALRVGDNRIIVNAMEPRGAYAEWDGKRLHLCFGGQGVWGRKAQMAAQFGLSPDAVRVTTPDVGGGFGMKAMSYPEYSSICHAAMVLGKPVRWMSERTEAMLSDNAGRDLVSDVEMAFDADLRIIGYRVNSLSNLGAYNSHFGQMIQSSMFSRVMTGVYDIPAAHLRVRGIYTNTTQVDAYRGAGRPEAIYALERTMDQAARVLGVDPFDLRQRNFVRKFPHPTLGGEVYDVGDFPRVLTRLHAEADVAGFAARKAESAARGRLRGMGLSYYIEAILGQPDEDAKVEFHDDGTVSLYVGTQSNGQGHETVFARFLSDRTGIPMDVISVVQGDSDRMAKGGGTGGSRSVTVQTHATIATVARMVAAFTPFLAQEAGADPVFEDGTFRVPGSNRAFTLLEAADLARAKGRRDLLIHEANAKLPGRSFPNGAHLAEVEVDPETGKVDLVRYTVTDDLGLLLAPQLAEGQVHGGVAQGAGQALVEHVGYDAQGQLLTASFMDYAMPRADDLPMIRFVSEPVPSVNNLLGMKGCGEAGTVGSMAAVANAVRDALAPAGVEVVDMPFTPTRVWHMLREAGHAASE